MSPDLQIQLAAIPGVVSATDSDEGMAVEFLNGLSARVTLSALSTSDRAAFHIQLPPSLPGLDGGVAENLSQKSVVAMLAHYAAGL